MRRTTLLVVVALQLTACSGQPEPPPVDGLPIHVEKLQADAIGLKEKLHVGNLLSLEQVAGFVGVEGKALTFETGDRVELLNGEVVSSTEVYGTLLLGPYPFAFQDSKFAYKRFNDDKHKIVGGRPDKPIELADFFKLTTANSEGWTKQGTFAVRLQLYQAAAGPDRQLGTYDTFISVERAPDGTFHRLPTILEGPSVNLVTSDNPGQVTISFVTDVDQPARVKIARQKASFKFKKVRKYNGNWYRHEVVVDGLQPATRYRYTIQVGEFETQPRKFKTAPERGDGEVRFAFLGDSRSGAGGTTKSLNKVNHDAMQRLSAIALRRGADLMLMAGDLSDGYTPSIDDFRTQLRSWKQSVAGFAGRRPVYTIMGNHEALLYVFDDKKSKYGLSFDRWPYETESTEAVFADEFVNPAGGPDARPHLPPYRETVYSFHYGPIKFIAFNTNYWTLANSEKGMPLNYKTKLYGGCPEGYVMSEQVSWIKSELDDARDDEDVQYIILFAHEPMFPNGKHLSDAMWYNGDNRSRAYVYERNNGEGKLVGEEKGVIEVRNELAKAIADSPKVAAVLASDEHAYYRTLVNEDVPVGDPKKDSLDGTKEVDYDTLSKLDLKHATWYMVCGGGGAPYSAELSSPWNEYWKAQDQPSAGYKYSPQEHLFLFHAGKAGVSVRVVNAFGETIDKIEDLMEVKGLKGKRCE